MFPADFVSEVCPDKPVKEDVQQGPSKHVSEDRNSEVLKPVIRKPQGPSRDNDGVSPKDRIQSAEVSSSVIISFAKEILPLNLEDLIAW